MDTCGVSDWEPASTGGDAAGGAVERAKGIDCAMEREVVAGGGGDGAAGRFSASRGGPAAGVFSSTRGGGNGAAGVVSGTRAGRGAARLSATRGGAD
ncbi:MAG: hypothetical protein DMG04_21505 [Acidobacteria bacterium]|nr:MAG: hypothetical protein DMG04_21505 [Acidobacteriota bacterium]